ncbi:MAG: response regulator [Lachnospiraceae bacterium]|nr:response regulator [Lachnospiraceae bacterium]
MVLDRPKVLLICDSATSFIVKAVKDGITAAGFDCETAKLSMAVLSVVDKPEYIFLYIDETLDVNAEEMVYIRDFCVEDEKKLFLVGYPQDIEDVKKVFPDEIIGGEFERPIDASTIGDELNSVIEKSASASNKKHILVVDDSGTMLRTIRDWLSKKYKVSIVNSAANAISFLATNHPDLVLLDYEMPVCSGPQMLKMIRSEIRTKNMPVIFLTAKSDRESVESVLDLHPDGYLLKSMSSEKLIAAIDMFFETQKAKKL